MLNIWSEWFWLPRNVRWEDVQNGPSKAVIYASLSDLWLQLPLVIVLLITRIIFETYCFKPLGLYLNISDTKKRKVPQNAVLEEHYQKSSQNNVDSYALAKQLDMSERQLQRWWRLRRNQDKPTKLVKFCESMWKGTFYLTATCLGLYTILTKDWSFDSDKWFLDYPHQGFTKDLHWYYMLSCAFYWSLTLTLFRDVRRKDFWQLFTHHIATITLVSLSWITHFYRIGSLVLILHDSTDIFLEFGKAAKYAGFNKIVNVMLVLFICSWFVMRMYMVPFWCLAKLIEQDGKFPICILMIIIQHVLVILNIYWSYLIVKMLRRVIFSGEIRDERSSESSDS